jgi:formamidopyrimidine-DNA glycosylase
MPELPEVETVVRDLRPLVAGRRVVAVRIGKHALRRAWSADWNPSVVGTRIELVRRRGKWIVIALDRGQHLLAHLGMTGQLTVVATDTPAADHTHLMFELDGAGGELRFRDPRRFGSVELFPDSAAVDAFLDARLGPEPFDLPRDAWRETLKRTNRRLKAVLMDQKAVAGVGNIYADEALFAAKLPPTRRGCDTTPAEADRLRKAVAKVLSRAIDHRGSSIRDYVGGSGQKGGFQNEFTVYGRTGEPCPRCGEPIVRTVLGGRSTHYCPECQGPSAADP